MLIRLTGALIALGLSLPSFAAYTAVYTITTDHTQAGTADSTNYPALVSQTLPGLKLTSSGGYMTNSSGFDHIYTSDAGCTTKLKWESVLYVGTTGQTVDFVQLATLHHSTNDTFYLCAGNSAITTDQSNKTGTWTAYVSTLGGIATGGVWHLQENGSPYHDSSGNGFGNVAGTYPTQVTGLFGFAQSFVVASSQYIQFGDAASGTNASNSFSSTVWFNNSTTPSANQAISDLRPANGQGMVTYLDTSGFANGFCNSAGTLTGSSNLANSQWHYLAQIMTAGVMTLFVDGSQIGTSVSGCNANLAQNNTVHIGTAYNSTAFAGMKIQEARVAPTIALSTSWITADYNSQKSGSTFLTISLPVISGGGGFPIIL